MKKAVVISAYLLATSAIYAQDSKIEIIPQYGYTFTSQTSYAYGDGNVNDNYSAGLAMDVRLKEDILVEIMYLNNTTDYDASVYSGLLGTEYYTTPIAIEYYQIGGVREFDQGRLRPFATVSLGASRFHATGPTTGFDLNKKPVEVTYSDVWSLAGTIGGGAKIMFSDRIGMRLMGRIMLPMYFSGVGIYCGGGCGGGASFGVYFLQMDLSAGIVIGLGEY